MNFKTNVVPVDSWGSADENGTWNGIIDSLQRNKTQVGIASFFYTKSLDSVAAFSPAISESMTRMFIKYPGSIFV